ncbi:hypothetical protein WICPIJ_007495 [Wickerhamomyces pijperi]|uniref:Uncharacterized protein n=1 Tax=Wickerhamomyces pijperi TaxID=599730 RepID=A0A9P8PZP1_WICPI|nr:hypothetical protein WICPIJ_007495 [Wickerhamomyces pijperi]
MAAERGFWRVASNPWSSLEFSGKTGKSNGSKSVKASGCSSSQTAASVKILTQTPCLPVFTCPKLNRSSPIPSTLPLTTTGFLVDASLKYGG